MCSEQHLFIDVLFVLFGLCHVQCIRKSLDSDIGGNTLLSVRRNGMFLPVDRTEALTI